MIFLGDKNIGASLIKASNQNIPIDSYTAVSFTGVDIINDRYGFFNPSQTDRLIIPNGMDGYYILEAGIKFRRNSAGDRIARITINDDFSHIHFYSSLNSVTDHVNVGVISAPVRLKPNDYIKLEALQSAGTVLDILGTEYGESHLSIIMIGK